MEIALLGGSIQLRALAPKMVHCFKNAEDAAGCCWDLLALTPTGAAQMLQGGLYCTCRTLLLPSGCGELAVRQIPAKRIVSYGLSARDSLTMSSLEQPAVVCVQRVLYRLDGSTVEPQEFSMPTLHILPEEQLVLAGLWLLIQKNVADATALQSEFAYSEPIN